MNPVEGTESLECTVGDGGRLKAFRTSLSSLGRIGGNLMVVAERHQVMYSACNPNRSAFVSATLGWQFFQSYNYHGTQSLRAVVSFRHILPILRTSKVRKASFTFMARANVLIASLECDQGLLKEFRIPFTDDQHFSPRVARDVPCVQCISQDPSSISKVLSAFHSASEMVSIKSNPSTLERGRDSVIELRTHMIHDEVTHNSLHTSVECQSTMGFGVINNSQDVPTEVSFNIKDFNVIVHVVEAFDCPLEISFSAPGDPIIACCSPFQNLQMELILVTLPAPGTVENQGSHMYRDPLLERGQENAMESTGHHNPFDMLPDEDDNTMDDETYDGDIVVSSPVRSQEPATILPGFLS